MGIEKLLFVKMFYIRYELLSFEDNLNVTFSDIQLIVNFISIFADTRVGKI